MNSPAAFPRLLHQIIAVLPSNQFSQSETLLQLAFKQLHETGAGRHATHRIVPSQNRTLTVANYKKSWQHHIELQWAIAALQRLQRLGLKTINRDQSVAILFEMTCTLPKFLATKITK